MANTLDTMTPEALLRGIIDGSLTEFEDDSITTIADYKLRNMTSTTNMSFPNLTQFSAHTFHYNPLLETLYFGDAVWANTAGNSSDQFRDCPKLEGVVLRPNVGIYPGTIYDNTFLNNSVMEYVDWNPNQWRNETYRRCYALTKIILRHDTVVSSNSVSCFYDSPFKSGGTGGYIYIPKVLYDHLGDGTSLDYKAATNWSAIDGYGTITWRQIEGSEYEFYYADGRPIAQSVTATLTNCSSSNSATKVNYASTFTTTITANEGYSLSSVTITMGGSDVTSTAYNSSTGAVSIASVSGPIVIIATAS